MCKKITAYIKAVIRNAVYIINDVIFYIPILLHNARKTNFKFSFVF